MNRSAKIQTTVLLVVAITAMGGFVYWRSLNGTPASTSSTLTIATVNNADMMIMRRLSTEFEQETGIDLEWVVLEENVLRHRVTTDIAMGGGQFDVITIGSYETPIWGNNGWLVTLDDLGDDYDYDDLIETVRESLSVDGSLYAAPFYAESSFTFFRKDLFENANLVMPAQPTYDDIKRFAQTLHDPDNGVYGVCLRGKPGWGENMAYVGTLVNTFGGRWFDTNWDAQLTSPEWHEAVSFYVDLLNSYGPPGSSSNGHNECRALFASGKVAIWIDATSAAGPLFDPAQSVVSQSVGFSRAPVAKVTNGAAWSWAWALAIPKSCRNVPAAKQFVSWATSQSYVERVGQTDGWTVAPPGTRKSTYANPLYLSAAPFAEVVAQAIADADATNPTAEPVPYTGIQYAAIPEFQGIGTQVGKFIASALTGQDSVEHALEKAQQETTRIMSEAGYDARP